MGLKQVLKALDAFPRAEDHLLQKTKSGAFGIITIIIINIIFLLPVLSSYG